MLSKGTELTEDELYFCSNTCYMQFALIHRSPAITEDKVRYYLKFSLLNNKFRPLNCFFTKLHGKCPAFVPNFFLLLIKKF